MPQSFCDLYFRFAQCKGISHMIYIRNGDNLPGLCRVLAKHFRNNHSVNIDVSDRHGQYEPDYGNYSK